MQPWHPSYTYIACTRCRTVADGTCSVPNNIFGCEEVKFGGPTKAFADDYALECAGKTAGNCGSKPNMKFK